MCFSCHSISDTHKMFNRPTAIVSARERTIFSLHHPTGTHFNVSSCVAQKQPWVQWNFECASHVYVSEGEISCNSRLLILPVSIIIYLRIFILSLINYFAYLFHFFPFRLRIAPNWNACVCRRERSQKVNTTHQLIIKRGNCFLIINFVLLLCVWRRHELSVLMNSR